MRTITITDVENAISFTFENEVINGGLINQIQGFEYPQTRIVVEDRPARNGAIGIDSFFGRRVISWVARFICPDILEKRREMFAAMQQTGHLKLVEFTTLDNIDLQLEAYVNKIVGNYASISKPILIEMIAPDYRLYSQTLITVTTGPTILTGGSPIPTPIPMSFGSISGTPDLEVDNNGSVSSPVIFTIEGPGTDFVIQNITTGESFTLDATLVSGEEIIVNGFDHTVTQAGANVFNVFSGDFFELLPGTNVIHFAPTTGSDSNTLLTLQYRHAYSGV